MGDVDWLERIVVNASNGGAKLLEASNECISRPEVRPADRAQVRAELQGFRFDEQLPAARSVSCSIVLSVRDKVTLVDDVLPATGLTAHGVRAPLAVLIECETTDEDHVTQLSRSDLAAAARWLRTGTSRPMGGHGWSLLSAHQIVPAGACVKIVRSVQIGVLDIALDCRRFEAALGELPTIDPELGAVQLDELSRRLRSARERESTMPMTGWASGVLDGFSGAAGTALFSAVMRIGTSFIGGAIW